MQSLVHLPLFMLMTEVNLQDPHCILEVCQIFLIIHEVYSNDSIHYYTHARDPVADMLAARTPALARKSVHL